MILKILSAQVRLKKTFMWRRPETRQILHSSWCFINLITQLSNTNKYYNPNKAILIPLQITKSSFLKSSSQTLQLYSYSILRYQVSGSLCLTFSDTLGGIACDTMMKRTLDKWRYLSKYLRNPLVFLEQSNTLISKECQKVLCQITRNKTSI